MAKVESVITIGRKSYRRFEVIVDGEVVYQDSTMTVARNLLERKARAHEAFLRNYIMEGNEVSERVREL